jgi:formate/nitrite transporter FocA (FNT family)
MGDVAPSPEDAYERAKEEGRRRLFMPPLEQVATGFIAGVTIVFGIVALAVTYALVEGEFGRDMANLLGALAFAIGIGMVFLIVGRTELFSENFFDPVAAAIDIGGPLSDVHRHRRRMRSWTGSSRRSRTRVGGTRRRS